MAPIIHHLNMYIRFVYLFRSSTSSMNFSLYASWSVISRNRYAPASPARRKHSDVFMNRTCSSFRTGGQEEGTRRTPLLTRSSIAFTRAGGQTHGAGGYFLSSVGRRSSNRPRTSISYSRIEFLNLTFLFAYHTYV